MNVLPHTFDAGMSDLFVALSHGGTLCVVRHTDILEDMAGAYKRMRATAGAMTPNALKLIEDPAKVPTLKRFLVGGEAMTQQLVDLWADRIRLFNAYGQTETTIARHAKQIKKGEPVTIGIAIPNVRHYVGDDFMRPVPVGSFGELLIGDIQVRGYRVEIGEVESTIANSPAASVRQVSVILNPQQQLVAFVELEETYNARNAMAVIPATSRKLRTP
ncbi:hypothetical protein HDU86_007811 [Geranomyces michiganensis]|nr:hypothetical protein HDU86_007811 [Geranomyces michiganensis]